MRLVLCLAMLCAASARASDWQPIVPEAVHHYPTYIKTSPGIKLRTREPSSPRLKIVNRGGSGAAAHGFGPSKPEPQLFHAAAAAPPPDSDTCSLFKVSMNQELFYQYVEYEQHLPDLKEFTLCMWTKFHNHSQDHPLFSYATADSPKEILSWVSNTDEASYFTMAVHGQTFFRLNYPLKLNKWYHSCQSWNGKTGEWQIWVNAERVGRGFHNRLVGHVIKGGGIAVTGQDQSLLYNKDGLEPVIKPSGLLGEVTMLQLYHVALTAGKAHKDHKHHHVHHFRHDGTPVEASTEAATEPPPPPVVPIGNGNFYIGGQLQIQPNLNLAGPQMVPVQFPNGGTIQQQYINGQLGSRVVSEQLLNSVQDNQIYGGQQQQPLQQQPLQQQPLQLLGIPAGSPPQEYSPAVQSLGPAKKTTVLLSGSLLNPANVQFIDDAASHSLYKRDSKKRDKRDNPEKELVAEMRTGKKDKRGLVSLADGSLVDEALLSPTIMEEDEDSVFQQSLLNGLAGFDGNLPVQNEQKETVDEREPAEAEVKAVMQVCSGCASEPFKKALIVGWRTAPKKLYSGAHYYKGLPICKAF